MACIVLALMTQGAGADGQNTSSGMDCVQETDYQITPDIVQDNEVFHLVVIGDSIAWGAGLEKDKKYSFLVAEWLSKQLKRPVDVKILAHTGATIEKTDDPVVKPPDLSSSSPTLMEQVDSIFDPEHVDLILVSGGINDVTVNNIIKLDHLVEPSESTLYYMTPDLGREAWDSGMSRLSTFSEADLRQKTKEIKPLMRDLLNKLITKCPNAAIVVTGYYPIISVKSTGLTETIRTLMPKSQFISDYQNLDNPIEKSQLSDKSNAFYDESTKSLKAAVQETSSKRVAFAGIEFKPENCYGAGDSFLWRIESGQDKTDDPLYECRVALVGDRNGGKDKIDKVAAVGHPNEKGARQYFSAIKEAIEKTSPEFLPKVEDFKGASLSTLALGESVEIDYVVSDNGELGLKQVELWRTQEKDKWPESPENPIQINTLAGENGPISGSFTDSPSAPGKYWYGIHVVDNAGNWNDEGNSNSNTNGQPSSFESLTVEVSAITDAKITSQAPSEEWIRTFGGLGEDVANAVQPTSDGGYIMAGYTNSSGAGGFDAWLIKTNPDGHEIWQRTFGGMNDDYASSVLATSDGCFILAGFTSSSGAGSDDGWLIKVDSDGNEIWQRTYGGTYSDWVNSVQPTSDGGYIMAGPTWHSNTFSSDAWLIKVDSEGRAIWQRTFSGAGNDWVESVQSTPDGGYIMAGHTGLVTPVGKGARLSSEDAWLIKTDSEGNEFWRRIFGGADDDMAFSIQTNSDGSYIMAGFTCSSGAGGRDTWLIKVDSDGNEIWQRTFGGTDSDQAASILPTSDGDYIIAGLTYSHGAGNADAELVKVDSGGNEIWQRTFGGTDLDRAASILSASDGGCVLAGSTSSFGSGGIDAWLIKVAPA